ncbi:MAG: neutral zinc metallopeptidase [Deltaproteobacteria bacterium]|nr:neutral zinc metallopeptidase [Deltaproteobacteria bacterium]
MRWDKDYRSPNVDDRRASGGGMRGIGAGLPLGSLLAVGSRFGWKGILIALVLVGAMTYGGMCSGDSLSCLGGGAPGGTTAQKGAPENAGNDEVAKFIGFVFDDVQKTFDGQLRGYQTTRLVLFRGQVDSACGTATSAVGPFYCPLDKQVYIDLTFYDQLRKRFGAPGDFAQAYVIAHEVGHHVQNLSGKLGRGEVHQIEVELQADCLAGAWAQGAEKRQLVEVGDIDEALNAASAIGDDTIQRKTQGRVQPETWTHGSAAQRSAAFKKGYQSGVGACGL